jgi:hypothetical protein
MPATHPPSGAVGFLFLGLFAISGFSAKHDQDRETGYGKENA